MLRFTQFKEATPFRGRSILFSTVTRQLRRRGMKNDEINQPQGAAAEDDEGKHHIGLERARDLFYALQSGADLAATGEDNQRKNHATIGHQISQRYKEQELEERNYHTVGKLRVNKENVDQSRPAQTVQETGSNYFAGNQGLHHLTFHPRRHRQASLPPVQGGSDTSRKFDLTSFARNSSLI